MCVAYPAKVVELTGDTAVVDVLGNRAVVDVRLVKPALGEYVLVHAGCAIEIVRREQADEIAELYSLLEEVSNEPR